MHGTGGYEDTDIDTVKINNGALSTLQVNKQNKAGNEKALPNIRKTPIYTKYQMEVLQKNINDVN